MSPNRITKFPAELDWAWRGSTYIVTNIKTQSLQTQCNMIGTIVLKLKGTSINP